MQLKDGEHDPTAVNGGPLFTEEGLPGPPKYVKQLPTTSSLQRAQEAITLHTFGVRVRRFSVKNRSGRSLEGSGVSGLMI